MTGDEWRAQNAVVHAPVTHGVSRRGFLRAVGGVGLAAAGASLLAACQPAPTAPRSARGGSVVYALGFEPGILSPVAGAAYDTHLIVRNIYDPLVFLDSTGQFRPALAKSWEVSADGLTYTFKLRDGVKFHDGTPFDASAVKFTWDTIVDPATKALTAKDLLGPNFKSVEAVDPLTARATFSKPYAPFLSAVSQYWLAPVSPTAYKKAGADYATQQVGTGPFTWKEYIAKDHITLQRNDAYNWAPDGMKHQGPAYLDSITFKFVAEVGVRTGTLQSGEVQIAEDLPPKDVVTLKADPKMALYQAAVPGLATVLFLNTQKEPTNHLEVRQAINYAINKDALIRAMFSGLIQPAGTALAPNTLGYNKSSELYQFDAAKAKSLLDQAGYAVGSDGIRTRDGVRAELTLNTLSFNRYPEILQVVQAQLRDVGLDVKLNTVNFAQLSASAQQDDYNMIPYFTPSYDPYVLGLHFHSRNNARGFAYAHFTDARLDQLLDDGLTENDQNKRMELYGQAQMVIMQNALIVPLYPFTNNTVARAEVADIVLDRLGWDPLLYDASIKK